MAGISASAVMALRNKLGISMMECKNALVETGGDEEKAIEILRKIFDFQNFRFFDFSKNFQLRRFFSTKIFATFSLIFVLNRSKMI